MTTNTCQNHKPISMCGILTIQIEQIHDSSYMQSLKNQCCCKNAIFSHIIVQNFDSCLYKVCQKTNNMMTWNDIEKILMLLQPISKDVQIYITWLWTLPIEKLLSLLQRNKQKFK